VISKAHELVKLISINFRYHLHLSRFKKINFYTIKLLIKQHIVENDCTCSQKIFLQYLIL